MAPTVVPEGVPAEALVGTDQPSAEVAEVLPCREPEEMAASVAVAVAAEPIVGVEMPDRGVWVVSMVVEADNPVAVLGPVAEVVQV